MTGEDNQLLSRREVARHFSVSTRTIARWEERGKLVPIRISSKVIRYAHADVLALLEESRGVTGASKGRERQEDIEL